MDGRLLGNLVHRPTRRDGIGDGAVQRCGKGARRIDLNFFSKKPMGGLRSRDRFLLISLWSRLSNSSLPASLWSRLLKWSLTDRSETINSPTIESGASYSFTNSGTTTCSDQI